MYNQWPDPPPAWTKSRSLREQEIKRILQTPVFEAAKRSSMTSIHDRSRSRSYDRFESRSLEGPPSSAATAPADHHWRRIERERDWARDQLDTMLNFELDKVERRHGYPISLHPDMILKGYREPFSEAEVEKVIRAVPRPSGGYADAYYVGIACSPISRWTGAVGRGQHSRDWDNMVILAGGDGPEVANLEIAVLEKELGQPHCKNRGRGGERRAPRGAQSFLYCVVKIDWESHLE